MIFNSYFQTTILISLLWPSSLAVCLKTLMRMWNEPGFFIRNKLTYFQSISVKNKLSLLQTKNGMNCTLFIFSLQAKCICCHLQCFDFFNAKRKWENNMLNRSKLRTLVHLTGSILGIVFFNDIRVTNLFKSIKIVYGNEKKFSP